MPERRAAQLPIQDMSADQNQTSAHGQHCSDQRGLCQFKADPGDEEKQTSNAQLDRTDSVMQLSPADQPPHAERDRGGQYYEMKCLAAAEGMDARW